MSGGRTEEKALDPEFLLLAYCNGYFPMAESRRGPVGWFSPDPRGIIPLETFRAPRSVRRTVRRGRFELKSDIAFEQVIHACAARAETWISADIIRSYTDLHRRGFAHSVETWEGGRLVGGLYGVALGGAFFGESMFSSVPDASKVALVSLVEHLRRRNHVLLDVQYVTEHLRQFGAVEIPRREYLERLQAALRVQTSW